ncbi:MAG: hypothetical protein KME31_11495 [Tolypothrix carrinoi HA7290-LM1]|nr:hypothetical protein [Tolypothrix carrinoi HA7290-LM1]
MTTTTNSGYVTLKPDILSGEPIIKGTRTVQGGGQAMSTLRGYAYVN